MRVEVVPRLEVRTHEKDDVRAGVVGTGAVHAEPELVAGAGAGGADVRVRVVPVDAPRGEHALGEPVLAGAPDVVHDLALPTLVDRGSDAGRDVGERLLPRDAHPLPLAACPRPLERVEDAVGVHDLVQRGRTLGAVAAAGAGVLRVPLELAHLERVAVDVGEEAAGGLAVEARRGHEHVAALAALGPRLGVEFNPVVPAFARRKGGEVGAAGAGIEGLAAALGLAAGGAHALVELVEAARGVGAGTVRAGAVGRAHASGTDWPACT